MIITKTYANFIAILNRMLTVSVFVCANACLAWHLIRFRFDETNAIFTHTQRTTTTDDASFMPSNHAISTMLGHDPPASESWPQSESQSPRKESSESQRPKFYHQYQSLNHQQQQQQKSFKVQRSPDGKLNLVFNDPLVSLQTTQQQRQPATGQSTTTPPRRPTISDSKYSRTQRQLYM